MQCILVMQMIAGTPSPAEIHPFPAPAPRKPASSPLSPGPWLHVFSSTLCVWFLLNEGFSWRLKKMIQEHCIWHKEGSLYCQIKQSALSAQSCQTICDPMDCSPPGSCVHGILQARILEWVAIPFSRSLPDPGSKPRSPTLQLDSVQSELPGKPSKSLKCM